MYLWWSLCTLHLHAHQVRVTVGNSGLCCCTCVTYRKLTEDVPLVKFMYLVFIRMPGESYCRRLRSLLLSLCYVFRALINSLVWWFIWTRVQCSVCFQVDGIRNLSESFAYVSFGIVLFVWEVLPISVVVVFFRVKRQSSAVVSIINSQNIS